MTTQRLCARPECTRRHYAKGWCRTHYHSWYSLRVLNPEKAEAVRREMVPSAEPEPVRATNPEPGTCEWCGDALNRGRRFCSRVCVALAARAERREVSPEVIDECWAALAKAEEALR
jgi:hypothetical protein